MLWEGWRSFSARARGCEYPSNVAGEQEPFYQAQEVGRMVGKDRRQAGEESGEHSRAERREISQVPQTSREHPGRDRKGYEGDHRRSTVDHAGKRRRAVPMSARIRREDTAENGAASPQREKEHAGT